MPKLAHARGRRLLAHDLLNIDRFGRDRARQQTSEKGCAAEYDADYDNHDSADGTWQEPTFFQAPGDINTEFFERFRGNRLMRYDAPLSMTRDAHPAQCRQYVIAFETTDQAFLPARAELLGGC